VVGRLVSNLDKTLIGSHIAERGEDIVRGHRGISVWKGSIFRLGAIGVRGA
jgi:hypothetical protein